MILMVFGFLLLIGAVGIQFLAAGGAFYSMNQALNTTIYNLGGSTLITQWNRHLGFMNSVYWITPLIIIVGILLIIFGVAQRREYYTSGGFR